MKWTDESPDDALPVWAGEAPMSLRVLVDADVLARVLAHLRAAEVEQGGLLLGVAYSRAGAADPREPCVVRVLAAVPAMQSHGSALSLRMDTPVWSAAAAQLESLRRAEAQARIVGWYHSHPGIGAFFSDTDRRTQRAWFAHPYSLGWVVDPVRGEHALFAGAQSRAVSAALLVAGEEDGAGTAPV